MSKCPECDGFYHEPCGCKPAETEGGSAVEFESVETWSKFLDAVVNERARKKWWPQSITVLEGPNPKTGETAKLLVLFRREVRDER